MGDDGPCRWFEGDEKAVAAFVRRILPRLRRYAAFLVACHGGGEVDDLVQETLVRIWRTSDKYDPQRATVEVWVLTLMHSCHRDAWRKRQRRPSTVWLGEDADRSDPDASPYPDDQVATRLDITGAMANLDDVERHLVWLVDREGFSVAEAAEAVGLKPSNARYHLGKAHDKLRALLNISDDNPDEECG